MRRKKKKTKKPFDLYTSKSEDADLDWLVKGVMTVVSLFGAVLGGIANGVGKLLSSTTTKPKQLPPSNEQNKV